MVFSDLFIKYGLWAFAILGVLALIYILRMYAPYWCRQGKKKLRRRSFEKARANVFLPPSTDTFCLGWESSGYVATISPTEETVPGDLLSLKFEAPDPCLGAEATVRSFP